MNITELFNSKYQLKNLKTNREDFLRRLGLYTKNQSSWMDTNIDFTKTSRWGHNHDFGEGTYVHGSMEDRHLRIMNNFISHGMPIDLSGKKVLVIGCYTGGDALLLAALGASVTAIEEVPLYAEIAGWLSSSFGSDMTVHNMSIDVWATRFSFHPGSFDMIYNCGVIYHLRDILTGINNCYLFLKKDANMFMKTMVCDDLSNFKQEAVLEYRGLSIPGYNWFMPSIKAVLEICRDIGFSGKLVHTEQNSRASFVFKKT